MLASALPSGLDARRLALSLLGLLILTAGPALAQQQGETGQQEETGPSGATFDFSNPLASQGMQEEPPYPRPIPMEGTVDPQEYRVGPGDILTISIGGATPVQQSMPVSAEGRLVLPESGGIEVDDRTLAEVQELAVKELRGSFENVSIEVTLAKPREFYVHVTGSIPSPGRFKARPVERLHSVLRQAMAGSGNEQLGRQLNEYYTPSLRSIRIAHTDGSQDTVDLMKYFATGDKSHNPYVRDGDVIYVDSYNTNEETVQIFGQVAYPGVYEVLPDDSVLDILQLASGRQGVDHFGKVRLTRRTDDSTTSRVLSLDELNASEQSSYPVEPRDVLRVPAKNPDAGRAIVTGFVEHPGKYVVEQGTTSLQDLVDMAGGVRPQAHLAGAVLTRSRSQGTAPQPQTTNLDFMGRTFLKQSLQGTQRISVNVARVLDAETDSIRIYDGDELHVPRDENSVLVVGEVHEPGFVPYRSDRSLSYYLREAGGTGSLSTETYVLKADDGEWLDAADTRIETGDLIFVNREPTAESPEVQQLALAEKETRMRTIQTILTGVSTITGIVTTFVALFGR